MPSGTTTADYVGSYAGLRAQTTWEKFAETDVTTSFRAWGAAQITQAYQYGARVDVYLESPKGAVKASKTKAGYGTTNPGASWVSIAETDWASHTFSRTATDYSVEVHVRAYGETVSGYGAAFANLGRKADTSKTLMATLTVPKLVAPAAHSGVTSTRNTDTQNTVSWTSGASPTSSKTTYIERQVNGGAWATLTSVAGTATSYVDKATSSNNSYKYRVRSGWSGYAVYSAWVESGITYNTPSAPGKPTASRLDANSVRLTFTNMGLTQTATELRRSTDGTTWGAATSITGTNITQIDNNPGGGTFYYQVRNTRGSLVSAWSPASNAVITITPPAAPTLTSPASSAIVKTSDPSIVFRWTHNPTDGSAQTGAQLRYKVGSGAYTTVTVSDSTQQYTLPNDFEANDAITWQACTKGADASYGPWASERSLTVCQTPSVAITTSATITDMPIGVTWSYTDVSGSQQQATVTLLSMSGQVLFSRTIQGSDTSTLIASGDYLPANNQQYDLNVEVRSTTSLTASTTMQIQIEYIEPETPGYWNNIDYQKASVDLSIEACPNGVSLDPFVPTESLAIMRRRKDGTMLVIADNISSGASVTDFCPPLDEPLVYVYVAYAASGAASFIYGEPIIIPSKMTAFFNFGDGFSEVAKLALDLSWSTTTEQTKEMFETAGVGDKYPIVDYGYSQSQSGHINGTAVRDTKELAGSIEHVLIADIEKLSYWESHVVIRLPYEEPFAADITVSQSFSNRLLGVVSLNYERVRSHGLAL